ncbi:hypothetical protein WAI453_009451 [Rhynchosporium graminicola]
MDLQFVLAHLGITVYWPLLFETGFETWEILKDITERDMEAIGMKLGHRRRLQREIATSRGHPTNAALEQSAICCCSTTGGQRNCGINRQVMAQSLRWSLDSGLGQSYATNSRRGSAMGGSVMAEGFPWGVEFLSPGA